VCVHANTDKPLIATDVGIVVTFDMHSLSQRSLAADLQGHISILTHTRTDAAKLASHNRPIGLADTHVITR